ncbi:hypothetical protein [Sphaerisporangium rhizosphaerae]|uniref:Lipoprotein n=1 Tax=Sphaerisporangium rhizosphaerae TaxID=2269375 RepID=A0ABW2P8L3_9ACTN
MVVSLVVVCGVATGGWLVWRNLGGGGGAGPDAGRSGLEALKKGTLTAQDVAKIDPAALFFASFRATAMQPVMRITEESYTDHGRFQAAKPDYVWESGFDYRTKQWRLAWGAADQGAPMSVCVDGHAYLYSYRFENWTDRGTGDPMCQTKSAYRYITDNLSSGGMTAAQADAWIAHLREEYKGLVNPAAPRLAEVKGRRYLRQVVDLTPVKRADGLYYGGQALMWSFKASGLDPQAHPYSYRGAMNSGYHAVYYIDPRSLLPAYSEIEQTPGRGPDGGPVAGGGWYKWRVRYHLPGGLPEITPGGPPPRPKVDWGIDGGHP